MKPFLYLPLVALFFISCSQSTPTTRVNKNPIMYDRQPAPHQALIDQGRIQQGMSKEAVFLAWGNAAIKSQGEENGSRFERWIYTRLSPIYLNNFGGYYDRGYGTGHRGCGYGYDSEIAYVQSMAASVEFKNNQVTRWQRGTMDHLP